MAQLALQTHFRNLKDPRRAPRPGEPSSPDARPHVEKWSRQMPAVEDSAHLASDAELITSVRAGDRQAFFFQQERGPPAARSRKSAVAAHSPAICADSSA